MFRNLSEPVLRGHPVDNSKGPKDVGLIQIHTNVRTYLSSGPGKCSGNLTCNGLVLVIRDIDFLVCSYSSSCRGRAMQTATATEGFFWSTKRLESSSCHCPSVVMTKVSVFPPGSFDILHSLKVKSPKPVLGCQIFQSQKFSQKLL